MEMMKSRSEQLVVYQNVPELGIKAEHHNLMVLSPIRR